MFHRQNVEKLLEPEVAHYIERHGLYRGAPPTRSGQWTLDSAAAADWSSMSETPRRCEIAKELGPLDDETIRR